MTDKEILLSRIYDKKSEADKNMMISHTGFLSVDEINDSGFGNRKSIDGVSVYLYGGFSDAERKAIFFVPECFDIQNIGEFFTEYKEENPFVAVKVSKDKFSVLSHRDYLGAVMGLGIKREMMGDIIISENGAYIICLRSVARFICENLKRGGRGTLACSVTEITDIELPQEKTEIKFHSVASMRLDNILSAGFSVPRSSCAEYINKGLVFVNSVRAVKCDAAVKEGDKIVLRGKGKVVLSEITGESKKGRVHINIKHYL